MGSEPLYEVEMSPEDIQILIDHQRAQLAALTRERDAARAEVEKLEAGIRSEIKTLESRTGDRPHLISRMEMASNFLAALLAGGGGDG